MKGQHNPANDLETSITLQMTHKDPDVETKESAKTQEEKNTKHKKKRRQRIRKNKEITIAVINARGMKGKIRSLETVLSTEKITIALITENQLKHGEQITIKGYRWVQRPRPNNKGGGVGILVSEKIAQNTTEDNSSDEHEHLETKWIKLECRPKNIAIGVFYGPQESVKTNKVKEIYAALNNQIAQKAQSNEIIIAGDYNAKLKIDTNECKQDESRNGKLLREIINNNNLKPANLEANHGIWTRVNRRNDAEKSVIDYILTTDQIASNIQTIIVDEEGILRIKGKNETDHNTIMMSLKINDARKPTFEEKWMLNNEKGWKKFNKTIQEAYSKNKINTNDCQKTEKDIIKILKETIES